LISTNALIQRMFSCADENGIAGKHSMPADDSALHNGLHLAFIGRRFTLAETIDGN
jgi:hypothetical protein